MDAQPNKIAYITGSSKGIGRALAELLLKKGFHVIGISRSNDLKAENFEFCPLDLSDISKVSAFNFEKGADHVILVNNAGLVGDINPVGSLRNTAIHKVMNVNTIAPQILCNNFLKRFKNEKGSFHVLNISSGAGKSAIDSWATYCASKAALDLFSETLSSELEWAQSNNWAVHSCAPGVVDTQMQIDIRSSSEEEFHKVQYFKDLKSNNELYTPEFVAEKLFLVIDHPSKFPDAIISVRNF
ncbi:MAG: benzil reductase ((S)-benzoin forming) [Arenicella sp.]|jgi:benzil reductase ((S)-benzoin forming)